MVKVVAVNGAPTSGKTTFETICESMLLKRVRVTSMVKCVKDVAKKCGWIGGKSDKDRKFLSDLKDLMAEYNDFPFRCIQGELEYFKDELNEYGVAQHEAIMFVDAREPADLQRLREKMNATCVLVRRESVENIEHGNHADDEVFNFDYDYVIENNGTINELAESCKQFIFYIFHK